MQSKASLPVLLSTRFETLPATAFYPGVPTFGQASALLIDEGAEVDSARFIIAPARYATVTGRVFDSSGTPVPGAHVYATEISPDGAGVPLRIPAVAVGNGEFRIQRVAPGEYGLVALVPRGGAVGDVGSTAFVVDGKDTIVTVNTEPAARVAGVLRANASGGLPDGLRVTAVAADHDVWSVPPLTNEPIGRVSAGGTFDMAVAPGRYSIRIVGLPAGWAVESIKLEDAGPEMVGAAVELRPGTDLRTAVVVLTNSLLQVSGRVTEDEQRPAGGAFVVLFPLRPERWRGGAQVSLNRASQLGRFLFSGVQPGDYWIVAVDSVSEPLSDPEEFARLSRHARAIAVGAGSATTDLLLPLTRFGDRR